MRENMLEYRGFANAKYGIMIQILQPQIKSLRFDGKVGNRYDRDTNFI